MKRSELTEFAVEEEGFKLKIRRGAIGLPVITGNGASNTPFLAGDGSLSTPVSTGAVPTLTTPGKSEADEGAGYIKSPMVGTFYRSPTPESKAFAELGTKVVENSAVCIIEAMKIMNEIQAEIKGTIIEVLVENGQPVEYGQRLFKIKLP